MRILLLAQWYEPVIGGEEIHVRSLAHGLAARGHDVTVAAMSHPDRSERYLDGHVSVQRIPATVQRIPGLFSDLARQSAPPLPDPAIARWLKRILKTELPDVVHAHNWLIYSYLPVRDPSIPLVLTLHDFGLVCAKKVLRYDDSECTGPRPVKCLRCTTRHYGIAKGPLTLGGLWMMQPALRRSVDCFIAVSEAVAQKNRLREIGVPHVVIPNFLADDYGESNGQSIPAITLPSAPYVLFVGGLAQIKGLEPLIAAYSRLNERRRPSLLLVGYTGREELEVLRDLPPGVTLMTDQPREVVAEAFKGSLFAVVPSIWSEPFGLVVLESMAYGRPVIASRVGGLPEVVRDGENGLLVEPNNPEALLAAMTRLIHDPGLRTRLGDAAFRDAERFRASKVIPEVEALYEELRSARPHAETATPD